MWLLAAGVVVLVLHLLHVGVFGTLAWEWVALPFVLAVVWWEVVERLLGGRRDRTFDEVERSRRYRIAHGLRRDRRRG